MSTLTKDLLFFDKEGYPYNLTYNDSTNDWSGKIYFDENSSDTFRTICLYIFEKVSKYNINDTFDLRLSQLFNYSGMTFLPSTYTGQTIRDIRKVNSSENFYSKWIIGDNFDRKFPVGTIVYFQDVIGSTPIDLSNSSGVTYYSVLGTQKDSILITTSENNGTGFTFIFSGGTISSLNIIKVPDYGNKDLVNVNNLLYYNDKKLSIYGSDYDDGIYTYTDYNILKTKAYDFELTPDTTGTLTLSFYLMTQRPELYEGPVNIYYNGSITNPTGTTIEFTNYINTNVDFTTTGQTIIFEKTNGQYIDQSNPEFTITGYGDREYMTTDQFNFYINGNTHLIESVSGFTGLTYNDVIEFTASPNISGQTFHDSRQFQVVSLLDNKIQVREYIIPESGYTYVVNKVIKKSKIQKLYCTRTGVDETLTSYFSDYLICYSTSNLITLSQDILNSGNTSYYYENTISAMRNKYRNLLDKYGLDLYHYSIGNNTGYTVSPTGTLTTSFIQESTLLEPQIVYMSLNNISINDVLFMWCDNTELILYEALSTSSSDIIDGMIDAITSYRDSNTSSKWATVVNTYTNEGTYLKITTYSNMSASFDSSVRILDKKNYLILEGLEYNYHPYYTGATAYINSTELELGNNFTYESGSTFEDYDVFCFSLQEKLPKYERIYHYESNSLAKNFYIEIYFDLEKDSKGYGFNINLNYVDYYIPLTGSSTTYTQDTINSFIEKYSDILDKKGINIYSGYTNYQYNGYTLTIEGQQPNIELYNTEVKVNSYSEYRFVSKTHNHSIVIDSSELYLVDTGKTLYDYELSTGMIINVSGFSNSLNNKQFNIIRITPNTIQLSYQGALLYEYNKYLNILINDFIRSPRGAYDRDIYYKFSWIPIEGNSPQVSPDIFYYDFSGSQLLDNGNLTYLGSKPLWNSRTENLVFLNKEPNNSIDNVYNPEYQQTVFDELNYELERLNSSTNYNYTPVPLQVFIGFNSKNEGVSNNTLLLEKIENIIFSGTTESNSGLTSYIRFLISGSTNSSDINYYTYDSSFDFRNYGFEPNQHISLQFNENTVTGHTLMNNYGTYTIKDVVAKRITVEEELENFDTDLSGKTYDFVIKTEPDTLVTIQLYGQTEVEDERFVQHLKLLGAKLESDIQPIFKESDINEAGIDYTILNRKRKELLSVYPEIYNYIGSYKALINAINFFGYNDLDLYEYYRCVKPSSPLYGQLQKVFIEDIFDNTIPGWEEPELDSINYQKTNLFNLTYKITDFDGNYVNMYSLSDVQQKLTRMVYWLRENIIPLSANILDITGLSQVRNTLYVNYDASNYVKKIVVNQECAGINFNHIETLNIDTNYLFTINFYLTSGATMPDYWTAKIKTFHLNETTNELEPVQYHTLYKTDLLSYSFNVDKNIDPYMYIETQSFNDYGLGYTNSKLFNFNEGRNFILVNNNFRGVHYKYLTDNYGFYIITDGRYYVIKY